VTPAPKITPRTRKPEHEPPTADQVILQGRLNPSTSEPITGRKKFGWMEWGQNSQVLSLAGNA
jgi:hypothetical protein